MMKHILLVSSLIFSSATIAFAHDKEALRQSPPGPPFVQVSDALPLPAFIPGLGTLFVDPASLPAGPFLAYDHDGKLSATIYMTPLEELQAGSAFDGLGLGAHEVSSVDIYYNAGHPGVEKPHAHVVLFHDAEAKGRLAK
ncbi:hypothetical protein ACFSZS_26565 [Seohaeicola zhoushanensis]